MGSVGMRARKGPPELVASGPSYKTNEEIKSLEVRIVGEMGENENQYDMIETNELVSTEEALARAQSRGLDLILINDNQDPPLAKIANVGKYAFQEKKRQKEKTKNAKAPGIKDLKLSYTIGEHDLDTRIRQMEKWMDKSKQQVRVTVVLKGRARMFEGQGRQLLKRVQAETASFCKTMNKNGKNDDGIRKTPRGDLTITLQGGADIQLLKELAEVGLEEDDDNAAAADDDETDEDDDDGDDSNNEDLDPEVAEILEEISEVKQDLLDCGIKPGKLSEQPEMQELEAQLRQARARVARAVHQCTAGSANKPMIASFVVLPAVLVGMLQPRRRPRWYTRAVL